MLLLGLHGFPAVEIHTGDRLELGPFSVEVFPAYHTPVPLSGHFNGPLPGELRLPLRLTDYRMDACFSFRITAGEKVLLVGSHPVPAQWLFLSPYQPASSLAEVLRAARPRVVAPIHWEDFMRPGDRPLRPMLLTPMQSGRRFPPIQRVDLAGFERLAREAAPGVKVLWMGQFQPFEVE